MQLHSEFIFGEGGVEKPSRFLKESLAFQCSHENLETCEEKTNFSTKLPVLPRSDFLWESSEM